MLVPCGHTPWVAMGAVYLWSGWLQVYIDDDQMAWFERELQRLTAEGRKAIVFTHAPPQGCGLQVRAEREGAGKVGSDPESKQRSTMQGNRKQHVIACGAKWGSNTSIHRMNRSFERDRIHSEMDRVHSSGKKWKKKNEKWLVVQTGVSDD